MSERFRRTAASTERVPALPDGADPATWRELLWDGDVQRDPADPSQALLATTDALLDGVRAHAATLPERARVHWLERTLGIPRLPAVPDEVVAVATADPAAVPHVLPSGTALRAAKAGGVPERTYVTTDSLTVLGTTLAGVRGYVVDGLVDCAATRDPATPFAPFDGKAATHSVDFLTDAIAFSGGSATVTLRLLDGDAGALAGATWHYSTSAGMETTSATASGDRLTLVLDGECAPFEPEGSRPFLRVTIPGTAMTQRQYDLRFTRADVWMERRRVAPDGAYLNDGSVDVSKDFLPFGPVPKRGDAFYVRLDEAFGRRLESLRVEVTLAGNAPGEVTLTTRAEGASYTVAELFAAIADALLAEYGIDVDVPGPIGDILGTPLRAAVRDQAGTSPRVNDLADLADAIAEDTADALVGASADPRLAGAAKIFVTKGKEKVKAAVRKTIDAFVAGRRGTGPAPAVTEGAPRIVWELLTADGWKWVDDASQTDFDLDRSALNGATSAGTEVAGTPGHFVRLRIARGDLGWAAYQGRIASFAAAAANPSATPRPTAADLLPPPDVVATAVRVTYRTSASRVPALRVRNSPAERLVRKGEVKPFRRLVTATARTGAVLFGLTVAEAHLGSALSFHVHVEQATACDSAGREHDTEWQFWGDDESWHPLDTLDGTRGLRQSGIVRLVAPLAWRAGCTDAGAPAGRWLRLVVRTPSFVGRLLAVHCDAVAARWDGRAGDPLVPLVPEQLKGLRTPVAGVKVTNPLLGTPGRATEEDARFRERATTVVRTRNRGVNAWDYETLVTSEFPEVAVARCLPHTGADGCREPGSVGVVVLPRTTERMPSPSVALAERIADALRPRIPVHAKVVVLCPEYVPVRFHASVTLRRGVAAAEARVRILAAVERMLHPLSGVDGAPFGRSLYPSSLVAFLEGLADVDHVTRFEVLEPDTVGEAIEVDACRGLVASRGDHRLTLEETL